MENPEVPSSPQPGQALPPRPRTNGKAIASLVLGILGFMLWIFTALPAIILGIIALRENVRSQGQLQGDGLALAGIATGSVSLLCCGLLMPALLLPAFQGATEAARRNQSIANMKEIVYGLYAYADENRRLPVIGTDRFGNRPNLSWRVHILPYIGHEALYLQFRLDEPWDSPHNLALIPRMPEFYASPNVPQAGKTVYLAATGPGAAFEGEDPGVGLQRFSDGLSYTIWFVEADADLAVEWTRPTDLEVDLDDPWRGLGGVRPTVALAAFGDSRVVAIPTSTSPEVLRALLTRHGRESIDLSSF